MSDELPQICQRVAVLAAGVLAANAKVKRLVFFQQRRQIVHGTAPLSEA